MCSVAFAYESSRDFLLDFNHAYIAFDLVVVKGDAEVIHESEDAGLVIVQTVKQSADGSGFCLWRSGVAANPWAMSAYSAS